MRKCTKCEQQIPEGRLKALPSATTCVGCSNEGSYIANQVIHNDEDYSQLEFIKDPETIAELNRLKGITSGHIPNIPD
jgi:hypothetical protein